MLKKISFQFSVRAMLLLLFSVIGFHLLILTGVIHYGITWGGRLNSREEMLVFESVSIVVNLLMIVVISIKGNLIREIIPMKTVNIILWFMAALFAVNTAGNVFSLNSLESYIFTPLTFVSSILCMRLAVE